MKITLAYPIEGVGSPDETVDVDDVLGRTLISDGTARAADEARSAPSRRSAAATKEA